MLQAAAPGPFPPPLPPAGSPTFGDWVWSIAANVWSFISDQAGPLTALAAVLTAVIAIGALRATANDSRERTRPIVLVFFRLSPNNESAFDLVLRNYGSSAASDINVKFDPPFDEEARKDHMVKSLAQRYDKPVPLLPPGSEITNVWWALDFRAAEHSGKNRYPTPDEATVTIIYKGNRRRPYSEKIKLDTNWMKGDTSTTSSSSRPGLAKQNTEALKNIAAEARAGRFLLRDIADGLGEPQIPDGSSDTLCEIVAASGSDVAALADRLGVSEGKASAIVALLDDHPTTGDIDVVSNGQIEPGK